MVAKGHNCSGLNNNITCKKCGKLHKHSYGKQPGRGKGSSKSTKGKTYEEIYGSKELADKIKKKRSESLSKTLQEQIKNGTFKPTWNKGLTKETDERVRKQGEAVSRGLKNSNYTVWNKGLTKKNSKSLQKLSNSMKGKNKGFKNHNYGKKPSWAKTRSKFGYRPDLNNTFFRSTWEANFARICNYYNTKWEFENNKYRCYFEKESMTYLPDFYLPEYDIYVEISGFVSNNKKLKLQLFNKYYPEKTLIHIFGDNYLKFFKEYKNYLENWE